MGFRISRLRGGELVAGAAGLALLVVLLAVSWYGPAQPAAGASGALDGWHAFAVLRWALLLSGALGIGLVLAQAVCRGPALPVCAGIVLAALAAVTLVWLAVRLGLGSAPSPPAGVHGALAHRAGGWLGLALVAGLFAGAVASLRQEGIREQDGPAEIPLVVPWEDAPAQPAR